MSDLQHLQTLVREGRFNGTVEELAERLRSVTWPGAGEQLIHDWRGYVPEDLMRLWPSLSDEARIVAWALCAENAHNEVWD